MKCPKCNSCKIAICKCEQADMICDDCKYKWHDCKIDDKRYEGDSNSRKHIVCPNKCG